MKKIPFVITLLLFAAIGLTACNTPGSTIDDTEWLLVSYGEQNNPTTTIEGTAITAVFNSADGSISGSAGCNTYFAQYETNGNSLFIFEIAYTAMACLSPEGIMEQEQAFLSLLSDAQTFEATNTILTIFCSSGRQLHFITAT